MIWGVEEFTISAMSSVMKYLQSHMYDTNYAHCKRMILCYNMLWIHFLNISSRGRRKRRWNKRIAEKNPGSVEAGALYGRENTCQVYENNILSGKPHFMDFGIKMLFKQSWKVLWRASSVFSITVFKCIHKNILPILVWGSSTFVKH